MDYLKNSLSNHIKKTVEESTCSFSQATQAIGDLALACQSMSTIDTIREGQEALRNEINMAQNQMLQQSKIQQIAAAAYLIGAPYRPTSSYFTNYNYNKWW